MAGYPYVFGGKTILYGTAGSGTVRVRPSNGANANTDITSTQSIHIKYAWSTAPYNDGAGIVKPITAYLANIKCRKGYKLVVANTYTDNGTTYTLNSSQVQAVYTAAQHWNDR
jgi:opacity protein-like surface antigen